MAVTDRPQSLDRLIRDISTVAGDRDVEPLLLPERDTEANPSDRMQGDIIGDRLRCMLAEPEAPLRAVCIQGLCQPCTDLEALRRLCRSLHVGEEHQLSEWVEYLESAGYQFEPETVAKGQASLRGGLLDCWPTTSDWPLRIEFFGDEVDSIRAFDPATQTTRERQTSAWITPASDLIGDTASTALESMPENAVWVWIDRPDIEHHADLFHSALADLGHFVLSKEDILSIPETCGSASVVIHDDQSDMEHDIRVVDSVPSVHHGHIPVDQIEGARRTLIQKIFDQLKDGWSIHICFDTPGVAERFDEEYLTGKGPHPVCRLAPLSEGFQNPSLKRAVFSEGDLYGYHRQLRGRYDPLGRKKKAVAQSGQRITEWVDIQPGDYVVHVDQGIGKYHGIREIEFDGRMQEVLSIEYAEDARLYVPVSQSHLLSRYIGSNKARPRLHRLGGSRWQTEKAGARRAAEDLASVLLESQAERDTTPGHAFAPDNTWQQEFEATFPFVETPDQAQAIEEVKQDMERSRPMDRLICGDVGFGKTEVAMRAAFKAVMDGKQVGLLVPTTVLARQHYQSFRERMAAFPVTIEMLSRFRTAAEQKQALTDLADGKIDVMIGTHRLVQSDVRFRDLGLVIIDEEQRFGVKHKEHLKQMRSLVDILTLSATPIPRTLYMSLTGARDLSTIQSPPRERQPVKTIVATRDDGLIRKAILREVNRGGQVFFLHNRVKTIHAVARDLQNIIPEASLAVGHGQMPHRELESTLETFIAGDVDVLLCTTIIESGVDIPNVNTIIIDRADRFGVADLYQLRGRVGRFKRKAYAYLLMPGLRGSALTARKRVHAIQKFSALGSGFKVAMQDLEIRGAGNILGAQQSGHIAAVGFELYCQFLKRTIARRKGEEAPRLVDTDVKLDFVDSTPSAHDLPDTAGIPYDYVEDENHRLHLFRRIASLMKLEEVDALLHELRDRFGPLPHSVKRLLAITRIRIHAAARDIVTLEVSQNKVMMMNRDRTYLKKGAQFPRLTQEGTDSRLEELEALVSDT